MPILQLKLLLSSTDQELVRHGHFVCGEQIIVTSLVPLPRHQIITSGNELVPASGHVGRDDFTDLNQLCERPEIPGLYQ